MVFLSRSVGRQLGAAACSLVSLALCVFGQAPKPAAENVHLGENLLPPSFSGWVAAGTAKTGTSPTAIDATNADALNEYGLKDFSESTYSRGNMKANVRAMQFADATGAYGAYTFYRKPGMNPEAIGNGGAGDAHEVVFWSGATVVDATFDSSGAQIIASALKALPAALPLAGGSVGVAPSLPGYLPADSLDKSTVRYAIGPAAYSQGGGVLPLAVLDFSREAEVITAQYALHGDKGTLTLIEYPTPQIAIHSEQTLNGLLKAALPATLQQGNLAALAVRRSGPIVAVTSGNFTSAEAQALLAQVKYQADVTWNRGGDRSKIEAKNAASMLLGIAYLTAIIAACALLLASFLGGGRALWRIMHGKPASAVYEEDFISLKLSEWGSGSPRKLP
jgi:hypothetical protein